MPRSTPRKPLFLWSPQPLIERAAEQPLENFVSVVTEFLLVVRLNDFSSELAAGLAGNESNTYRGRPRRINTISVAWSIPEQTEMSPPPSMRPMPLRSDPPKSEFEFTPEFLSSECYVTRIRKRSVDPNAPQVTIGRMNTQDIPLQHPSVSREHASFSAANGSLTLSDVGSRNHTFVNDELVRGTVRLKAGDTLKFGAVRCCICTASGLWHAVRS